MSTDLQKNIWKLSARLILNDKYIYVFINIFLMSLMRQFQKQYTTKIFNCLPNKEKVKYLLHLLCHTQTVETVIKPVTKASNTLSSKSNKQDFIKV